MRFYPDDTAAPPFTGYPFLPAGSEDHAAITEQQEAALAELEEVDDGVRKE